jgi:peptidoglycan/LPS O-acetylase OafA/YrhL
MPGWREVPRLGYRPAFDGIRGLAVLNVVALHLGLVRGAGSGVTMFFALSGFLITALLLEEFRATRTVSIRRFYVRRALRLLPALFAVLAVDAVFVALRFDGWDRKAGFAAIGVTLAYMSNWANAFHWLPMGPLGHTWSLAVEEQFYLLCPLLLMVLLRRRVRHLDAWLVLTALLFVAERFILAASGASENRLYNGLDTRADALVWGAAAAVAFHRGRTAAMRPYASVVAMMSITLLLLHVVGGIAAGPKSTDPLFLVIETVVALLTVALIVGIVEAPTSVATRALQLRPLRYVGQISYGLYLWHYLLIAILDNVGIESRTLKTILVFGVAIASYQLLEAPCLRLKLRFAPAGSSGIPFAAALKAG